MANRELSGIYMRTQTEDGKWTNVCWEELPVTQRMAILATESEEFKDNMIKRLTDVINELGESFDAYREEENAEETKE